MDFSISDDQKQRIARARERAGALDPSLRPSARAFWMAAGAEGWLGWCLPRDLGGGGLDAIDTVLACEALRRGGLSSAALFSMGAQLFGCAMALANHASAPVRAQWIPALANGHAVGALALSEPQGGSDTGNGQTVATFEGDEVRLNGERRWCRMDRWRMC